MIDCTILIAYYNHLVTYVNIFKMIAKHLILRKPTFQQFHNACSAGLKDVMILKYDNDLNNQLS